MGCQCKSPVTSIPATPTGTTSSPGPTQGSSTVTMNWAASTGATSYGIGVKDIATGLLVVDTTTTATSYPATLPAGKQYRWNVAAVNSAGTSVYTTPLYFQTPSSAPTITSVSPNPVIGSNSDQTLN